MARTAVAAGTWTAVSNRVSRRQANRWAQQDQQQYYEQQPQQYYQEPAPAAAAASTASAPTNGGRDRIDQLKDLADLKAQGVLSDQEFASEKARILGT
jgi:hypothetical protein